MHQKTGKSEVLRSSVTRPSRTRRIDHLDSSIKLNDTNTAYRKYPDYNSSNEDDSPKQYLSADDKAEIRRVRNRLSAEASRRRRLDVEAGLRDRVTQLENEVTLLQNQLKKQCNTIVIQRKETQHKRMDSNHITALIA
jgi:hypothetical protein